MVCAGLIVAMTLAWVFGQGSGAMWEPFMAWRVAVLLFGLLAT